MANAAKNNRLYIDSNGLARAGKASIKSIVVVGGTGTTRLQLTDGDGGPLMFDSGIVPINEGKPFSVEFAVVDGLYVTITTTGGYAFVYLK